MPYHLLMGTIRFDDSAVTWREVGDDIVAVDLRTSEYITVNAAGRLLWLQVAAGASNDALVEHLVQQAGIDQETARRDVAEFLTTLRRRSLITES